MAAGENKAYANQLILFAVDACTRLGKDGAVSNGHI